MAEIIEKSAPPPKRRRWLRALTWTVGTLLVLILVVYFVGTSATFLQNVILPRVSRSLHANVTVSGASIHPFSEITLRDLKVQAAGQEPVVSAPEVRVRYHLLDILRGNIDVDEIALVSPTVSLVVNPDGSGNLDPILKALQQQGSAKKPSPPATPSKPMRIALTKFTLSNATIRKEQLYRDGRRDLLELTNVNVTIENIKNGQTGKLALSADIGVANNPPAPGVSGALQAALSGNFSFSLSPSLKPLSVQGGTDLKVSRAKGALSDLSAAGAKLDCDVTPTEIKRVALTFQKNGAQLGELLVSGPLDLEKTEGRLKIDLLSLDRRALNLAGAAAGIDFGTTTINSTNTLQLANSGSLVALAGRLVADKFQLIRPGKTSPAVDVQADYDLTLNRPDNSVVVRKLDLTGVQNGSPLLSVSCSGTYGAARENADLQLALRASLARLFQVLGRPGLAVSSGTLELKGRVTQKQETQTVTGNLTLADFSAQVGTSQFQQFGSTMDLNLQKTPAAIQITGITGSLSQGGKPAGRFDLSGTYFTNQSAQMKVLLSDFNQNALRPLLDPLLADKKLASIAINGNASVQYNPAGTSTIRAGLQVTNLVVNDPQHEFPATALQAKLELDAGLQGQSADLRQLLLTLTPTQRAQNQVQLQGHVDLSDTNAYRGNLKLTADSLDVTSYFDMFAARTKTAGQPSPTANVPATPAAAPPGGAGQEAPAMKLPIQKFTVDVGIGRLYLHEIEITNLQTTVEVEGSKISVKPCQLALNGAPVNATVNLDLGIPGYQYAVTFDAEKVPFAPLVDTFHPALQGAVGGTLTAQAQLSGQGTTGTNLKKYLAGQFDIGTTNLNLSVGKVQNRSLKLILNVVAMLPELIHNPAGVGAIVWGGVTGRGGFSDELMRSPIDVITARGKAGNGVINLQQAIVRSPTFEADAHGTITLEPVLTNSAIQIPVGISLSRSVADRINLVPANTPTNVAYVKLPDFFSETGTVGDPRADIKKLALAGTALRALGTTIPGTILKPGELIRDLGGVLKGGTTGPTNAPQNSPTNPPTTQQSPVKSLLQDLLGPK